MDFREVLGAFRFVKPMVATLQAAQRSSMFKTSWTTLWTTITVINQTSRFPESYNQLTIPIDPIPLLTIWSIIIHHTGLVWLILTYIDYNYRPSILRRKLSPLV